MSNLNLNQKLIIKNNKKLIYQTANTQVLYLYPLTLKDYVDNLKYLLPIKIDIILSILDVFNISVIPHPINNALVRKNIKLLFFFI